MERKLRLVPPQPDENSNMIQFRIRDEFEAGRTLRDFERFSVEQRRQHIMMLRYVKSEIAAELLREMGSEIYDEYRKRRTEAKDETPSPSKSPDIA